MTKKSEVIEEKKAQEEVETMFHEVKIRGTVVGKVRTTSSLVLVIATANPVTQKADYPRAIAFGEKADEYDKLVATGDRIEATASIQTSKKYPAGTVVISDVTKCLSRMDAAFAGAEYEPDINRVLIKGIVAGDIYNPNDKVSFVPVKIQTDGKPSYPRITCFGNIMRRVRNKKKGDYIEMVAYVQTRMREDKNSGEMVKLQSFVAQNLR